MNLTRNIGLLLAALVFTHLYKRAQALWSLEQNAPATLQPFSNFSSHEVKFADKVRNCEDVVLLDGSDGWALLSCDSGRDHWNTVMGIFANGSHAQGQLYLYNYASPNANLIELNLLDFPSARTDFHPLGIEYHSPSRTLYVVNHAVAGSRLELFRLFLREHSATHLRTIIHPQIHSPNSIAVIDEDNIYLTNDHFFLTRYHRWLALVETYLAVPGGNVVHIHLPTLTTKIVARIPFANGVKLLNYTLLAVASSSGGVVNLYSIDPATPRVVKFRKTITVPFLPDNLSVDADGTLLIAGHGHPASMTKFTGTRALCRSGTGPEAVEACKLTSPSYVVEWSEDAGLQTLYVDDAFSTSTTAVKDVGRGIGLVTGLFENGVLVWRDAMKANTAGIKMQIPHDEEVKPMLLL